MVGSTELAAAQPEIQAQASESSGSGALLQHLEPGGMEEAAMRGRLRPLMEIHVGVQAGRPFPEDARPWPGQEGGSKRVGKTRRSGGGEVRYPEVLGVTARPLDSGWRAHQKARCGQILW